MKHPMTARDILELKSSRMITISPDATVLEAIRKMVENKIGAMLVADGDDIVGIWTERDHLRSTLDPDYAPGKDRIGNFMQTNLNTAPADTPIFKLQETFLGLFIRHILVVHEGKYIGLLSVGDVIRATLLEKDQEIRELHQIASWEYYENWGWHRKHRSRKKEQE